MIRFIQKLIPLWKKKQHQTNVECEMDFAKYAFADKINEDLDYLRKELVRLRAIKEPKPDTKQKIVDIENQINECSYYKNMVNQDRDWETHT